MPLRLGYVTLVAITLLAEPGAALAGNATGAGVSMPVDLDAHGAAVLSRTTGPFGRACGTSDHVTGIRRLGNRDVWTGAARVRRSASRSDVTATAVWNEPSGTTSLVTRVTALPKGEARVRQTCSSAEAGVVGAQWGFTVPDTCQVLVPGNSGLRLDASAPYGTRDFEYPMTWEAQLVLIQGPTSGVLIHAEDNARFFKALHIEHRRGAFVIAMESRCTAPFGPAKRAPAVTWRVRPYRGSWLVGAGMYRAWSDRTFGLSTLRAARPAWTRNIQLVVLTGLSDTKLLQELAKRAAPSRTLLYVPDWRRDGYDRNYPDYTPRPGFAAEIARAKAMGFRVMLHVNYFGCTMSNPAYEGLRACHTRDPFTGDLLYWDWQRATPPIKFAYLNPAASAWRKLFVQRMCDVCAELHPDALHLDQTLCIFNDAEGPIEGRNMMQGSIALHRELTEALPNVALSGEGLNEITCRYEAFAQRHPNGINFVDATWDENAMAMAHPVSSAVLTPWTTLYGYLGMTSPDSRDFYLAWMRVYDRYGVLPTWAWPTTEQLRSPSEVEQALLTEARWFQRNRPTPDFQPQQRSDTLFAWRGAAGNRLVIRKTPTGVARSADGKDILIQVHGQGSLRTPGSIAGWNAYNNSGPIGLDPQSWYLYTSRPSNPTAFHVWALPKGAIARRITDNDAFATIVIEDPQSILCDLTRATRSTRSGETLSDGEHAHTGPPDLQSSSGATVALQGDGIAMHPPWHGARKATTSLAACDGVGYVWMESDVTLPPNAAARFDGAAGLRAPEAEQKSDGVTYRVTARPSGTRPSDTNLASEILVRNVTGLPLTLDLTPLAGKRVTIRLEAHPGPAGNPSFDWAIWRTARVVLADPRPASVAVYSPKPFFETPGSILARTVRQLGGSRYVMSMMPPAPGYLLHQSPNRPDTSTDLTVLPFHTSVIERGGEGAPAGYATAEPGSAAVRGVERKGIFAHPPPAGQTLASYAVVLPSEPARLTGYAGIRDGAEGKSNGVGFRIQVNGVEVYRRDVMAGDPWQPFSVPLDRWTGKTIVLTLITDSLGDHSCDWAYWGEPHLEPIR